MARKKTVTMQKVAESVGVSVSTVSRVFNSSDFATQETRDRVIKAAARVGYTRSRRREPSHPITTLGDYRGGGTELENIVLLASEEFLGGLEAGIWIYRDVVPTLQRVAKSKGFNLILSSYGQDDQWDPGSMSAKHIAGILWMTHNREDLLARISKSVPVVVLNDDTLWPPQSSVMSSNRMVLFKAVEHLMNHGHQRIAYFDVDETPAKPSVHCRERYDAYNEAILHFDLDGDPALIVRERFGIGEHPEAVARAMDRMAAMKSKPTALISSLTYSIQFLKETRKRSITVPDDLSIVAVDNAPAAELVDPSLTTVDCLFGRCAEIAVELLLEQKSTPRKYAKSVLIEPKLIVRNSTARLCPQQA